MSKSKNPDLHGKNVHRKRTDLPWLWRVFVNGQSHNGETLTLNKREAERIAKAQKTELAGKAAGPKKLGLGSMRFGRAAELWWIESGSKLVDRGLRDRYEWLVDTIGAQTLVQDIRGTVISTMVTKREATERLDHVKHLKNGTRVEVMRKVKPATVNATTTLLRTIVNHVNLRHEVAIAPIDWPEFMLDVEEHEIRIISEEELAAVLGALREDMHAVIAFALVSGKRIDEILSLTWKQIDWRAGTMRLRVKGSKPVIDPLGEAEIAILRQQRGHHDEYVFTYVAQRTRTYFHRVTKEPVKSQVAGERYPLAYGHLQPTLDDVCAKLKPKIEGVTLHVLRHTAATLVLRKTGDVARAQKMLNHANIETTLKFYAKVVREDVRDAKNAIGADVLKQFTTLSPVKLISNRKA